MKCKSCKRDIPDMSVYCNWCGEKQLRERKKKTEIKVPSPRQLGSGNWFIQLRAEGVGVTEATAELCAAKARAIRAGFLETKKAAPKLTVKDAVKAYIDRRRDVLSPASVRGYEHTNEFRFKAYADMDIHAVDWQKAINDEAKIVSAKTLKNAWGLMVSVLRENNIDVPRVTLPQVVKKELPWLDYAQIQAFLKAAFGQAGELEALLALHSLRQSEIMALTWGKVSPDEIRVEGATVTGSDDKPHFKEANKNSGSRRVVPVMIPRLKELLDGADKHPPGEQLITCKPNTVYRRINAICDSAGLPPVGVHGLRRSFSSLAYHLGWSELETMRVGGWSDFQTMRDIYTKLSDKDMKKAVKKMTKYYGR